MKKILILTIALFASQEIFAQIEIGGFGGWLWTGKIPAWRQDIKISDEGNYGATIGLQIRDEMLVNFEWNHIDNKATFREYNFDGSLGDLYTVPLTLNYYMLGFNYLVTYNEPVVPYGLINVGLLHSQFSSYSSVEGSSNTYFVAGIGGGLRYYISDNIGIKLQARLLLPMQFGGIGFGCGIGTGGTGCGAGVSTYTSIIQGDFTGGIVLKLGN
jgi:opacity protein-like surface antigen